MATWIETYKALRAAWVAKRGVLGNSSITGAQMPRMLASDALALMGPCSEEIIRFQTARQAHLPDGGLDWGAATALAGGTIQGISRSITVTDYLMKGVPRQGDAQLRVTPTGNPIIAKLELRPGFGTSLQAQAHKQLMAAWQAGIVLAAHAIGNGAGGISRTLPLLEVETFWSKLYQVFVALEVAGETPNPGTWEKATEIATDLGQRTQVVLEQAADVAGRAAAEIAETAGRVAGGAASGFFEQAGLTALLVTGGAVYLAFS